MTKKQQYIGFKILYSHFKQYQINIQYVYINLMYISPVFCSENKRDGQVSADEDIAQQDKSF